MTLPEYTPRSVVRSSRIPRGVKSCSLGVTGGGVVGGVGVRGGVMYILLAPMGDVLAFTGVVSCPDAMASEIDLFIAPLHKRRCTKALMGCLIE